MSLYESLAIPAAYHSFYQELPVAKAEKTHRDAEGEEYYDSNE